MTIWSDTNSFIDTSQKEVHLGTARESEQTGQLMMNTTPPPTDLGNQSLNIPNGTTTRDLILAKKWTA